jgi:hypothetical protein
MKTHLRKYGLLVLIFGVMSLFAACGDDDNPVPDEPQEALPKLKITSPENNSAVYLDGRYTGKVTPVELEVSEGEHTIGVGQYSSETYLKREIKVEPSKEPVMNVDLTEDDVQKAKTWKLLFVGVNSVCGLTNSGVKDTLSYTKEELDIACDYLQYSFQKYLEPYSYNTIKWEFERHDIENDVVLLNPQNLFDPQRFEKYITEWGLKKGDYDLIVIFYRFEGEDENSDDDDLGTFNGMAWYEKTALSTRSSYLMIRYYKNVQAWIDHMKANDPGMYVHEWLHTVCETFYPSYGTPVPDPNMGGGSVLHAIEAYGYRYPWMTGYRDLMRGQIREKNSDNPKNPKHLPYVGMSPEDFLEHTVREAALEN